MISNFLFNLLNLVKPYTFIEICAKNLEFSRKISSLLEVLYDGDTVIRYIFVSDKDFLETYKNCFRNTQSINYYFFNTEDLNDSNNFELLNDVEMSLIHNINDYNSVKNFLDLIKNSKCNVLDRFFKNCDDEILKKSSNLIVKDIPHLISPEPDVVYENGKFLEKYYVAIGLVAETFSINGFEDTDSLNSMVNFKTKNSLPDEKIQENIIKNVEFCRLKGIPEICPCEIHDGVAYLIGGAPSYKKEHIFKEILEYKNYDNHYIFVSKTSHDYMIDNGVIPHGCIYLDPREHLISYAERSHKDVTYFVASQCDPNVIRTLNNKNVKIYLYHVLVDAGEDSLFERLKIQSPPVVFGSTSMIRGILMLNLLGFYKFKLFGLDSSYEKKPKKVHGYNQKKLPLQVVVDFNDGTVSNKSENVFWTDAEMVVQCNDLEMLIKNFLNIKLLNYSEGMFKRIYDNLYPKRNKFIEKYFSK